MLTVLPVVCPRFYARFIDSGSPHDCHANKDSYPHDSSNQCIILSLQLPFMMINVQLMLV